MTTTPKPTRTPPDATMCPPGVGVVANIACFGTLFKEQETPGKVGDAKYASIDADTKPP